MGQLQMTFLKRESELMNLSLRCTIFTGFALMISVLSFDVTGSASAEEYELEKVTEAPPTDDLVDEIAALISDTSYKVVVDGSKTVAEIWLCKELEIPADFEPSSERLYPFAEGELIGLIKFPRRAADFRDQDVNRGVYTLRFSLQPVDGNHEGTSPTRDFLCVVRAEDEESPDPIETDDLMILSSDAIESSHPGMFCLQKLEGAEADVMRHNEDKEWWIARLVVHGKSGGKRVELPIDLVVAGHADE